MALRPRYAILAIVIGTMLAVIGWFMLSEVRELTDHAEHTIASVQGDTATFTTNAGSEVVISMEGRCKNFDRRPGGGCAREFAVGDEFLLNYDTTEPTHFWTGATPGGGKATGTLYSGIVLVAVGLITLLLLIRMPTLTRRKPPAA
jgi:hypothetical protein